MTSTGALLALLGGLLVLRAASADGAPTSPAPAPRPPTPPRLETATFALG